MQSPHSALDVRYEQDTVERLLNSDRSVLAIFEFGHSPLNSSDPRHVPVALPQISTNRTLEVWRCTGEVTTGEWNGVRFARNEFMTMGHIALDLRLAADMRAASDRAYRLLQQFLHQGPHYCPVKIWNFIPGINQGAGDEELYRLFCIGRSDALAGNLDERPPMPAATAIGAPPAEPALQVYFLATALPGVNVENPRQLSAWHYPRQYGPRSPLFSRGTVMQVSDSRQFLISGTASVVGHETHHDNATDQVIESVRNVKSLLEEGRRLLGGQKPVLDGSGVLRVYLRHPRDLSRVQKALAMIVPDEMPRIFLNGDICRTDLLTEVDGIVGCH